MNFDLRLPLGLLFTVFGLMLVIYGFIGDPAAYARSLGLNLDLGWGAVLLVFGLVMLGLALRGRKQR